MFSLVWVPQDKNFKAVFVSPKEAGASTDSHLFSLANLIIKVLFFFLFILGVGNLVLETGGFTRLQSWPLLG